MLSTEQRQLVVRVVADLTELKKNMAEGTAIVKTSAQTMTEAGSEAGKYSENVEKLWQEFKKSTAAGQENAVQMSGVAGTLFTTAAATDVATVSMGSLATATIGFATTVAEVVAAIAPYIVVVGALGKVVGDLINKHNEAVKAAAEALQQRDLYERATKEAGHAVTTLAEAEKVLEAAQRHRLLMDPAGAAQNYIDKLSEQAAAAIKAAAEEEALTEGLAAMGVVRGGEINVAQLMAKAETELAQETKKAAAEISAARQREFDAIVNLSNKIYDLENSQRDEIFLMQDLARVGVSVAAPALATVTQQVERLQRAGEFVAATFIKMGGSYQAAQAYFNTATGNSAFTLPSFQYGGIGALVNGPESQQALLDAMKKMKEVKATLSDLAQAFAQLAQVSGGAFGGAVQSMGEVVNSINLAKTGMDLLNSATKSWTNTLTAGLSVATAIYSVVNQLAGPLNVAIGKAIGFADAFRAGGASNAKQTANQMVQSFVAQFGGDQGLQSALEAVGKSSIDATREILNLYAATKDGSAAAAAAIRAIMTELEQGRSGLLSEASRLYGPSQADKERAVKNAQDILNAMMAAGTFTQEQLNKAYFAWQKAMADAGDEAAKAWVKAREVNEEAFKKAGKDLSDLLSKRETLMRSIAAEAPEEVMGVIEAQQRGQLAILDQEIREKADAYEQLAKDTGQKMSDAIVEALSRMRIMPIEVPYYLAGPPLPTSGQPGFASGTQGRYLDFGRGTPVMLHGRERVMTEAEGRTDAALLNEIRGLRGEVRRQSSDFFLAMRDALVQAG